VVLKRVEPRGLIHELRAALRGTAQALRGNPVGSKRRRAAPATART
jgi:hypothetical protein